jgi:hypothetical protein
MTVLAAHSSRSMKCKRKRQGGKTSFTLIVLRYLTLIHFSALLCPARRSLPIALECFTRNTHLGWEGVALDAVLTAELIVESVMNVNLVEPVAIGERTACEIHRSLIAHLHAAASHAARHAVAIATVRVIYCIIVGCKYYTMSCICYCSANL